MSEIENLKIYGGATYTVGNQDIIANEWEAGVTYVKGKSYVIREHKLYVCNVTHTSVEPFDTTKWTEIRIGDAIAGNTTAIGDLSQLTTTDKSSLVGAVNEVNTGLGNTYTKNDIDSYNVRKYTTSWGTTCQTTLGRYQFIVLRGFTPYVVWLASTNDINVANIASNTSANGTGSVTFDNVVFTRLSNNNLKVELSSNGTITIFG